MSLDLRRQARERGGAVGPGHTPRDLDAALDQRGEIGERARLEVGAPHAGAGQRLSRVGQVVVGLPAHRLQECDALARPSQGLSDGLGLDERLELFEAFSSQSRAHLLKQERPNTVELQCFE